MSGLEVTQADRAALKAAWNEYASWMGDPDGKDDTETAFEEAAKIIARHRLAALGSGEVEQRLADALSAADLDGPDPEDYWRYLARAALAALRQPAPRHGEVDDPIEKLWASLGDHPTTPPAIEGEGMREKIADEGLEERARQILDLAHAVENVTPDRRTGEAVRVSQPIALNAIAIALTAGSEGWRDIESAPKDGTDILVVVAGNHSATGKPFTPEVVNWSDDDGWWNPMWGWDKAHSEYLPTHWMPLPSPPAAKGEE